MLTIMLSQSVCIKAMRKLLTLLAAVLALIFMAPSTFAAESGHEEGEGKIDPKEIIFEHLGDGYGWEVPFNHHKRIPLPVIVIASDGLHVFSSSRVTDGQTYQDGNVAFKIAGKDSQYKGRNYSRLYTAYRHEGRNGNARCFLTGNRGPGLR